MIVLVTVCGVVCVLAAVMALLATRLERMAVSLLVVGVTEAALVVALQPQLPEAASPVVAVLVLVLGAVAMTAVVLGAMAVLEVDARPTRQLRPWKVLLLLPLIAVAIRLGPDVAAASHAAPTTTAGSSALTLTLITIAAAALAVPLLARRREAA